MEVAEAEIARLKHLVAQKDEIIRLQMIESRDDKGGYAWGVHVRCGTRAYVVWSDRLRVVCLILLGLLQALSRDMRSCRVLGVFSGAWVSHDSYT